MSKLVYHILIDVSFVAAILPPSLITVINYFWHNLGDKSFFSPFLMMYYCKIVNRLRVFFYHHIFFLKKSFFLPRMPFNWKTPFGYCITMLIQSTDVYYSGLCGLPIVCFLIGGCYLLKTIVNDITNDLFRLNTVQKSEKDRINTKILFCNIIQNFSDTKQLSKIYLKIV